VEYFCNGLVLFLSYDHLNEILSTIDDYTFAKEIFSEFEIDKSDFEAFSKPFKMAKISIKKKKIKSVYGKVSNFTIKEEVEFVIQCFTKFTMSLISWNI
jgi:hypothetical protein